MKLNEFSLDKALAELGAAPAPAAPPGAAPTPQQAPQGAPQQPDPKAMAAHQAEVAAQKKEIQDAIKTKQMEIVELQKQLATIK
jgi:hypothetical protein